MKLLNQLGKPMSNSTCPSEIAKPDDWLRNASLAEDAKACAVLISQNCGRNDQIIDECCTNAAQSQNLTNFPYKWVYDGVKICSLPESASNNTYQEYQNCLLNAPSRQGGFRCNDLSHGGNNTTCFTGDSAPAPPIQALSGKQICTAAAMANSSSVLERCCGDAPISFGEGCWQYCLGPADDNLTLCIESGFSDNGLNSHPAVACWPGQQASSSQSATSSLGIIHLGSTVGFIAVIAYVAGLR